MHFDVKRCLLSSLVQTNHSPDYHVSLMWKKILIFRLKSVTSVCAFIVFESVKNKMTCARNMWAVPEWMNDKVEPKLPAGQATVVQMLS